MSYKVLMDEDLFAIKEMLWNGYTQAFIAHKYHVTQAHIANIASARFAGKILWPDGTDGPLARWKKLEIMNKRKKHGMTGAKASLLPKSEYERMARITEANLHPTPVYDKKPVPYKSRRIENSDNEPPRIERAGPPGWEQHPLAVQATAEGDSILLEACRETLIAASPDIWEEDIVYNLIQGVAERKRHMPVQGDIPEDADKSVA